MIIAFILRYICLAEGMDKLIYSKIKNALAPGDDIAVKNIMTHFQLKWNCINILQAATSVIGAFMASQPKSKISRSKNRVDKKKQFCAIKPKTSGLPNTTGAVYFLWGTNLGAHC